MAAILNALLTFLIDNVLKPTLAALPLSAIPDEKEWLIAMGVALVLIPPLARLIHRLLHKYVGLYRRLIYEEEKYCGSWLETITKNNLKYMTLIDVYFNRATLKYSISGRAFDESLNLHATFSSYMFTLDESKQTMEILYSGAYVNTGRTAKGWCIYFLSKDLSGGHGYIVDFELDETEVMRQTLRLAFVLTRLNRRVLRRRINSSRLRNDGDRLMLLSSLQGMAELPRSH
ncbi:MAG TPA: hypothetical protein VND19_07130 [Acetobacteraceae bacterium]|nr:hypothetical protein [Acetobacteraceae bacterium]